MTGSSRPWKTLIWCLLYFCNLAFTVLIVTKEDLKWEHIYDKFSCFQFTVLIFISDYAGHQDNVGISTVQVIFTIFWGHEMCRKFSGLPSLSTYMDACVKAKIACMIIHILIEFGKGSPFFFCLTLHYDKGHWWATTI